MKDTVNPTSLSFGAYSLKGVSTAGIGTCLTIPEWKVCLDVAQGLPFAFPMNYFLISHMHQDHAAGIPYLISQKAMQSHRPAKFFLPPGTAEDMDQIMSAWSRLEGHVYDFSFQELRPGTRTLLYGNLYAESFLTKHRVVSQGYTLLVKNKRLDQRYAHLSRQELIKLKDQGISIEKPLFIPKVSFTGDTQIEFLDLSPNVVNSETLVMEVTYIDEKKGVESARKWGHIHFKELVERIPRIQSKNIVWIHLSARYSRNQVQAMIDEFLPHEKHRLHLL